MKISGIIQLSFILLCSPLISGLIKKAKNFFRMRQGASVFQPYFNLAKLFSKDESVSRNCSWIFHYTPVIVFASMAVAASMIPVFTRAPMGRAGDILVLIFIMAFARFFLSLAGLDAGSAFGGMGSSREMFISSLVEPVMLLSLFTVSLQSGSTDPGAISSFAGSRLSACVAAAAFFIAVLAETSRIPVDNQETHLELTMVHEAMVLEYSGRSLAFIEWASYIKQMVFLSIVTYMVPPHWGLPGYLLKMPVLLGAIALIEVSLAKMRLFRLVDLFGFAFVLSVMSVIMSVLGW